MPKKAKQTNNNYYNSYNNSLGGEGKKKTDWLAGYMIGLVWFGFMAYQTVWFI